ncbi:MAG: cyclic nucleotide-binding protein [Acidobacteria bacterium]|nr:MAG: cyclic nucleotide-binding protein [Acidobacteriota bacterium]
MPCNVEMFADIDLFNMLHKEDQIALADVVDYEQLEAGQTLFQTGDPGDSLFIVHSGEIELYIKDTAGQKIVLTTAREGEMFGELALLDSGPRSATALALMDSGLLVLDRDDLLLLFQKRPDAALHMLAAMSGMTRKADQLLRTRVSRNANEEVQENLGVLQKIADWLAWFSGSMPFLLSHTVWFAVWILLNTLILPRDPETKLRGFDPYPFGLLTMIVSLEAIFLACFVLISQNRQAQKDKVRADIEYDVNIKAELEVAHLHEKTDRLYEEMLARFVKLEKALAQQTQVEKA